MTSIHLSVIKGHVIPMHGQQRCGLQRQMPLLFGHGDHSVTVRRENNHSGNVLRAPLELAP